ncbi:MAG: hypothetical protein RL338_532 [Chloroflexota bacterium]
MPRRPFGRALVAAVAGLLAAAMAAGSLASPVAAATFGVAITASGFVPATITITAGDTVVWTNLDAESHTILPVGGGFRGSGTLRAGRTHEVRFERAGNFPYGDRLSSFTGLVVVLPAPATPTPSPTPTPRPTPTAAPATPTPAPPADPSGGPTDPAATGEPGATPTDPAATDGSTATGGTDGGDGATGSGDGATGEGLTALPGSGGTAPWDDPFDLLVGGSIAVGIGLVILSLVGDRSRSGPHPAAIRSAVIRRHRAEEAAALGARPTYLVTEGIDEDAPIAVERGETVPAEDRVAPPPATDPIADLPPPDWLPGAGGPTDRGSGDPGPSSEPGTGRPGRSRGR